jgi:hypothetical protein
MMMITGIWWFLFTVLIPAASHKSTNQTPTLLFTKNISENCALFEIFDHGEGLQYYKLALSKKDVAAIYYTDEEKQEVIIQKKTIEDQYSLKYIFVVRKKTYEIVLRTCAEHLTRNKKELYILQQKLLHNEVL